MKSRIRLAWAMCSVLGAGIPCVQPLVCQGLPRTAGPGRAAKVVASFRERLSRAEELLQEGEPKKAYATVSSLLEDMADRIIGGEEAGRILGVAAVFRSIAAYELGRTDEAVWHWYVANQLFPGASEMDLSGFGKAGLFLNGLTIRELGHYDETIREVGNDDEKKEYEGEVTPPRKRRAPMPRIPTAKRGIGRVSVAAEAVIGRDGRTHRPLIVDSKGELTLVYALLDALRRWEYAPEEMDGEPVAVLFNLTVKFRLGG